MQITLTPVGAPKGGEQMVSHDLNFASEKYDGVHVVVCMALDHECGLCGREEGVM